MTRARTIGAAAGLVLAGALAACGGTDPTASLSPADLAQLRTTCEANASALATATAPGAPAPLAQTASYPAAFCAQVLAGGVPATANSSSPSWLPGALQAAQEAGRIAGIVLPIVLPLL
jgi:hypothetical protein